MRPHGEDFVDPWERPPTERLSLVAEFPRPVYDAARLEDAHVAGWLADTALRGSYRWAKGMGWLHYNGKHWADTSDEAVIERTRQAIVERLHAEAQAGADVPRLGRMSGLLGAGRLRAMVSLAKGIMEIEASDFDRYPDLLNVGNGVVELATGRLIPHDPGLLLTRITEVDYLPCAQSADWFEALKAIPGEVASWLQVRFGQAATGHMTDDDVLPVLQGGGSNGKSTIVNACKTALGGHAVAVPERVLMANPGDHPTELTTLRGARLAIIEETPESGRLSVKRLKDVLGSPEMTARKIRQDNVTWRATHSLFLTTNYTPSVNEVDHGTWRRLALIPFPFTFVPPGMPLLGPLHRRGMHGLRERLVAGRQHQHEAVLAWIVEGAMRWYAAGQIMPGAPVSILEATRSWRTEADLVLGYVRDRLVLDPNHHIATTDMFTDFNDWLQNHGNQPWSDKTFTARFESHDEIAGRGIHKTRVRASDTGGSRPYTVNVRPLGARYRVWAGVRFRTDEDDQQ